MKLKAILFTSLCFILGGSNSAQVTKNGDQYSSKFLIDVSKPLAYLEFDHIGPREPLLDDEPNVGIWLRLKNNCQLPIAVLTLATQSKGPDKETLLADEIVPDPQGPARGADGVSGGIIAPRELGHILDLFRWPNQTEAEVRSAEEAARSLRKPLKRPRGYNSQNGFESFRLTLIAPGNQVYFTVPTNHVSRTWHFEVPFRIAVPNSSPIRPPYSYLAFYQEDLDRAQGNGPGPTTP